MRSKLLLSFATAVLAVSASTATAQYPPATRSHVAVQLQNSAAAPPIPVANGVAVPAPPVVINGVGPTGSPMVLYPTTAPPTYGGTLSAVTPQQTVAVQQTFVPQAPAPISQTQVYSAQPRTYTPTYYWYYYQPPYQTQYYAPVPVPQPQTHWAPAPVPGTDFWTGSAPGASGSSGPMTNARGETGHVRYPYYSYRRPWHYHGQPSFNVTIDGPVW